MLLEVLRRDEVTRVLDSAAPGFADYVARDWSESDFEEEAEEFCRLFVLPDGARAQAGAWLPAHESHRAANIDALCRRVTGTLGLTLPPQISELPPDHASPLLLIAAWLIDHDPRASIEFIEQAIGPWSDSFCDALASKAESPLYKAAAEVMRVSASVVSTVE